MRSDLTVLEYNNEEKDKLRFLPNRFIEAFQPEIFIKEGFPTNVNENSELIKFVDSMHDSREKWYFDLFLKFSEKEFLEISKITNEYYKYSKEKYNTGVVVKAPIMSAIYTMRIIKALVQGEKRPTIFEIGGGCGAFGILCIENNFNYYSTDITQSFYLLQSSLMNYFTEGNYCEKVNCEHCDENIIHIPYWKLWLERNNNYKVDIIVANHCLLEMHERALRFYLVYCRKMLERGNLKYFVFQNGGSEQSRNTGYLIRLLYEYGYKLFYSDITISVYTIDTTRKDVINDVNEIVNVGFKRDVYYKLSGNEDYSDNYLKYNRKRYYNSESKVIKQFIDNIELKNDSVIEYSELVDFYFSIDKKIKSMDEEFIEYIGLQRL